MRVTHSSILDSLLWLLPVLVLPYIILIYSTHLLSTTHVPSIPIQTSGHMWQNQNPGSSVRKHHMSPPIASQTMARSLLMCGFISRLQQVTYSWGTLITVIVWVRSLSPQPGLPCSCDFKEYRLNKEGPLPIITK